MATLREKQVAIENRYSRHNIRKHFYAYINKGIQSNLRKIFYKVMDGVRVYLGGTYYKSKNKRIADLREEPLEDLTVELFIALFPVTEYQTIQRVVGALAPHLPKRDDFDNVKSAAELLAVSCYADLAELLLPEFSYTGTMLIKCNIPLDPSLLVFMAEVKYLPPMICKPLAVYKNNESGYLTKDQSILLGKGGNHHDLEQALDVVNIASKVKLSLDEHVLLTDEQESTKLKEVKDPARRTENFLRMRDASRIVYDEILEHGNEFYFFWRYDTRGRIYNQGYHVTIQGNEYRKSLVNLATKHVIRLD